MMDASPYNGVQDAWTLVERGDLGEARVLLQDLVMRLDAPAPGPMQERWEDLADVEECLAGVCLLSGLNAEVLGHAQQAILRSRRFRAGSHLLAAHALSRLGQAELASSKLEIIAEQSDDYGLKLFALALARPPKS